MSLLRLLANVALKHTMTVILKRIKMERNIKYGITISRNKIRTNLF